MAPKPPKVYDGHALGRDDPMWQCYVKESTKQDGDMVEAWNKNIDVLLVFAALFSAVVTAFLIESYKNLKPDPAYITAASVSRMAELVESMASGKPPPNATMKLPSLYDFQPADSDIAINTLWFCSLALSMTVALVSMLVKQWGEGYLYGRHFTIVPYYVQARTRQARFNQLGRWKVRYVMRALHMMMHGALGLFLWGLIILLKNLTRGSMLWTSVATVVICAFAFYLFATLVPLVCHFSPYHTPLSFRRIWSFLTRLTVHITYLLVNRMFPPSEHIRALPTSGEAWSKRPAAHELAEWKISTSVTPDNLTAQVIIWLVSYARDSSSVDMGIRAIAGTRAGPEFWDHLIQIDLVVLVAQRFTSFFKGALEKPNKIVPDSNDPGLMQVALCSQALAKIVKHSSVPIIPPPASSQFGEVPGLKAILLPEDQISTVQYGLLQLAGSTDNTVAASGLCGVSAWSLMGREPYQYVKERNPVIQELVKFIEDRVFLEDGSVAVSGCLLNALVEALNFEISYATWEIKDEELAKQLTSVVELCSKRPALFQGPARGAISVTVAILAVLLNDYPPIPEAGFDLDPECSIENKFGIQDQYQKARYIYDEGSRSLQPEERIKYLRQWRAVWITELCTKNPKYLQIYSDRLLLFGLAGILKSSRKSSFQFDRMIGLFISQLQYGPITQQYPTTIPSILDPALSIKSTVEEAVVAALESQPTNSELAAGIDYNKAKADLLQSLSTHGKGIEFRSDSFRSIAQLLKSTEHRLLQARCVVALDQYWPLDFPFESGTGVYSPPPWYLSVDIIRLTTVFHYIDDLNQDMPPQEQIELRQHIISCFIKLAQAAQLQCKPSPPPTQPNPTSTVTQSPIMHPPPCNTAHTSINSGCPQEILDALEQLLLNEGVLFETFIKEIACGTSSEVDLAGLEFWRNAVIRLPDLLSVKSTLYLAPPGTQQPPSSIVWVPEIGSSPQVIPGIINSLANPIIQAPAASEKQKPRESVGLQMPTPMTTPQAFATGPSLPDLAINNTSLFPVNPNFHAPGFTPQTLAMTPSPQASTGDHSAQTPRTNPDTPVVTSYNTHLASCSSCPSAYGPVQSLQYPPMNHDAARRWLLRFCDSHANAEGTLGETSTALRNALNLLGQEPS